MHTHFGGHVNGLDHVVVAVPGLTAAAEAFRRLGFTTTPQGRHPEWGTANHCLMFRRDYVELLAAEGAGAEAEAIRTFTRERAGIKGLGFATTNGPATIDRLRRAGLPVPTPSSVSRVLDSGVKMMFSVARLPPEATPGLDANLVQHITAERERHPEWLDHPNGAVGIASVTAVVDEPGELIPAYDIVFGPGAATPTDNTVTIHTGRGLVFLTRPDDLTQLHPEAELDLPPNPPAIVALSLRVTSTDRAARVLDDNDVEYSRDTEGTIRIPPSEACGIFLEMVEG